MFEKNFKDSHIYDFQKIVEITEHRHWSVNFYVMKGAFHVYGCNLGNSKNLRIDTSCNAETQQIFQVIGDVVLAHDQEFGDISLMSSSLLRC